MLSCLYIVAFVLSGTFVLVIIGDIFIVRIPRRFFIYGFFGVTL